MTCHNKVSSAQAQAEQRGERPNGTILEKPKNETKAQLQIGPKHQRRADQAVIEEHLKDVHLDDGLLAASGDAEQPFIGAAGPVIGKGGRDRKSVV